MSSAQQVEQYRDQGYFLVDDLVDAPMLQELTAAAQRVVARVRSGEVVDDADGIRTGGPGAEPAFVSGLLAPQFGEPVFARYLSSVSLARYLQPLLGDDLRLGWVHLCAVAGDYGIGWHRDVGGKDRGASCEQELELLRTYRRHLVKWHMALFDDPCLWLVPGSQRRYRTDRELEVLTGDKTAELAGAAQIHLRPGQTIFWNGNTIHRGLKPEGMQQRLTLMGALVDHRAPYDDSEKGDVPWLLDEDIRDSLPGRARGYYDNWRSLAEPRMAASSAD